MSEPPVIRELTDDGILIITLNKPDTMNALNRDISNGIEKAMRETKENDDVRVLVITGTGRGFCAGADLSSGGPARSEGDSPSRSQMVDKVGPARIPEAIADADVPIIGAINGAAAGAGFGLALCCDIRIASTRRDWAQSLSSEVSLRTGLQATGCRELSDFPRPLSSSIRVNC